MALLKRKEPEVDLSGPEKRRAKRDFQGLVKQLRSEQPDMRRWAARDLAQFPEAASVLCAHLEKETDETVMEAVLASLAAIGGEEAVKGLIPYLRSENVPLRNGVVETLQLLSEHVGPYVEKMLQDSDPDVRQLAVEVVGALPQEEAVKWLLWIVENEEQVNIVAAALDALAEVGTPDVAETIRRARERFRGEPFIEFAVDVALRRIEGN